MKRSIGDLFHSTAFTLGGSSRSHRLESPMCGEPCPSRRRRICGAAGGAAPSRGSGAPILTQATRFSISRASSGLSPGGILRSLLDPRTAAMRMLSSGLPGTKRGAPDWPPRSMPARDPAASRPSAWLGRNYGSYSSVQRAQVEYSVRRTRFHPDPPIVPAGLAARAAKPRKRTIAR